MAERQRERLTPIPPERGWNLGRPPKGSAALSAEDLGPRGVGGVLDRAFEVLRAHFGLLMTAGLVVCVPLRILLFFELRPALGASIWTPILEQGSTSILATLLGALAARVFGAHVAGGDTSAARVLGIGPLEIVGIVLLSTVTGTLAGLGVCFFFVGAFLINWLLALAPVVYMLETERSPLARVPYAIRRSVSLVAGSFWRWLGLATILGILGTFVQLPLAQLDAPATRAGLAADLGLSISSVDLTVCLLGGVFTALLASLSGVVFAAFYFDQRARLEGVDLYLALGVDSERQPASQERR